MRTRIFTPAERKLIRRFLDGEIPATNPRISQIRTRVKKFDVLSDDIDLYLTLRGRLAEPERASSA